MIIFACVMPLEFEEIETWIADHEDGPNEKFDQPYTAQLSAQ